MDNPEITASQKWSKRRRNQEKWMPFGVLIVIVIVICGYNCYCLVRGELPGIAQLSLIRLKPNAFSAEGCDSVLCKI